MPLRSNGVKTKIGTQEDEDELSASSANVPRRNAVEHHHETARRSPPSGNLTQRCRSRSSDYRTRRLGDHGVYAWQGSPDDYETWLATTLIDTA
jgi:hypothetical protein